MEPLKASEFVCYLGGQRRLLYYHQLKLGGMFHVDNEHFFLLKTFSQREREREERDREEQTLKGNKTSSNLLSGWQAVPT